MLHDLVPENQHRIALTLPPPDDRRGKVLTATQAFFISIFLTLALAPVWGSAALQAQGGFNPDAAEKVVTDIRPDDVVFWTPASATLSADGRVAAGLRLRTDRDFTLYVDRVEFKGPAGFAQESVTAPEPTSITDPMTGEPARVWSGGDFTVQFAGPAGWTASTFPVEVTFTACTSVICLFPHTVSIDIPAFPAETGNLGSPDTPETAGQPAPAATTEQVGSAEPDQDFESRLASKLQDGALPLGMVLLIVFLGGLLTNLTPCVAPMIPITVRLLASQTKTPLLGSSLYALGILATYTTLGLAAALSGGLFGSMLANPTFNLVFAAVISFLDFRCSALVTSRNSKCWAVVSDRDHPRFSTCF